MGTVVAGRDTGNSRILVAFDDNADGQSELECKVEVALIMRRHGHDRAGAVVSEHVITCPDRDLLTVDRVDCVTLKEYSGFLASGIEAIHLG